MRIIPSAILVTICIGSSIAQSKTKSDSAVNARIDVLKNKYLLQVARLHGLERSLDTLQGSSSITYAKADSARLAISTARNNLDSVNTMANASLEKLTSMKISKRKRRKELTKLEVTYSKKFADADLKVNELTTKIGRSHLNYTSKLSVLDSFGTKLGSTQMPAIDKNLADFDVLGNQKPIVIDDPLRNFSSPQLQTSKNPLPSSASSPAIPNIDQSLPTTDVLNSVKSPDMSIPNSPNIPDAKLPKAEDINVTSAPELLEDKLKSEVAVKELTMDQQKAIALKAEYEKNLKLIEQYKDKDMIRKQLNDKLANVANEQLSLNAMQVSEGSRTLAKYKRKYPDIQSLKNLPKRPPNPMQNKPLRERLEPGIWMQVEQNRELNLYLSPQIGYRLSGRLSAGLGFTYRIQGSIVDSLRLYSSRPVFGPKVFANFLLLRSFYTRLEYESLRASPIANSETNMWINNVYIGLGKRFTISRRWKGDVQGTYNFLYDKNTSPYSSKFALRFGFIINLEKKTKVKLP